MTFSFSSVSYLSKNPADLFSHISIERPPPSSFPYTFPTQREQSSSKLLLSPACACVSTDFFHLSHHQGGAAQTNHDIPFSLRNQSLFITEQISPQLVARCQTGKYICLAVCCSEVSAVIGGYGLMYVHRNNKKPIIESNRVLEVIMLVHLPSSHFYHLINSLGFHWDKSNLSVVESHCGE